MEPTGPWSPHCAAASPGLHDGRALAWEHLPFSLAGTAWAQLQQESAAEQEPSVLGSGSGVYGGARSPGPVSCPLFHYIGNGLGGFLCFWCVVFFFLSPSKMQLSDI